MRVYAKCMTGLEDVWIGRMNDALHLQDPQRNDGRRIAAEDGGRPGMILGRVWDVEGVRSWRLLSHPGIGDHSRAGRFASSAPIRAAHGGRPQ